MVLKKASLLIARPHHLVLGPQSHDLLCQTAAPSLHVLWFKKQPHHRMCEMERFGGVPSPQSQGAAYGSQCRI